MLDVEVRNLRAYLRDRETGRYWLYHYSTAAAAQVVGQKILEAWQNNADERTNDLSANFVGDPLHCIPSTK